MISWPWLLFALGGDGWNDGFGLSLLTIASNGPRATLFVGVPWPSRDGKLNDKGALVSITRSAPESVPTPHASTAAESKPSPFAVTRFVGEAGFGTRLFPFGDVDADGAPELLVRHGAGLSIVSTKGPKVLFDISYGRGGDAACGWIDLNRDGVPDVLMSGVDPSRAPFESSRIRAFSGKDGSLIDDVTIPVGVGGGVASMVRIPDVDGDEVDDLAIGWAFDSRSLRTSKAPGRVDIVSGCSRDVIRTIAGDARGDRFGATLSTIADLDGDGVDDLVVGAPGPDEPEEIVGATSGRVILISAKTGKRLRTIEVPAHGSCDRFGGAIAVLESKIEPSMLAIGAKGAGVVQVIRPSSGEVMCSIARGPMTDFGCQLAFVPDEDGDGRSDMAISAVRDAFDTRGGGSVFVCSTKDGRVLRTLTNSTR